MAKVHYLLTHPNVVVSREMPVPKWPLSARGVERLRTGLRQPWVADLTAIYCSEERKAVETAQLLAQHRGLGYTAIADLGENDRTATGFLPPEEFERVADEFFARPDISVRGWERAVDAQLRMVRAVEKLVREDRSGGSVAVVAHGAVGTLLYCHLAGLAIDRRWDQPANGGGNFYGFTLEPAGVQGGWQAIDSVG